VDEFLHRKFSALTEEAEAKERDPWGLVKQPVIVGTTETKTVEFVVCDFGTSPGDQYSLQAANETLKDDIPARVRARFNVDAEWNLNNANKMAWFTLVVSDPPMLDSQVMNNSREVFGRVLFGRHGGCSVALKAERAAQVGAVALILSIPVLEGETLVAASTVKGFEGPAIPVVCMRAEDEKTVLHALKVQIQFTPSVDAQPEEAPGGESAGVSRASSSVASNSRRGSFADSRRESVASRRESIQASARGFPSSPSRFPGSPSNSRTPNAGQTPKFLAGTPKFLAGTPKARSVRSMSMMSGGQGSNRNLLGRKKESSKQHENILAGEPAAPHSLDTVLGQHVNEQWNSWSAHGRHLQMLRDAANRDDGPEERDPEADDVPSALEL